ncbi:MAG: hypothetical protein A3G34_12780 [Candidatus Lindowbacteria bacterium RIFCSPLOWO2_12_FULL_62_27]|nr:MAG: hypothetical protein A3G34_12780 [Candidatus Lindowbacteria bacterium RIFCSPLOWO2_12_FULL_62_27]
MDRFGRVSCGNRLAGIHSSDRLFLDWRSSWGQFEQSARRAAGRYRYYVKTDVRKFYPHVRRGQLIETLGGMLPKDPLFTAFRSLILNDGMDLPAGPTISGVLANAYLTPFDHELLNGWKLRGRYHRYVDDMFLFGADRREIQNTFNGLRKTLWSRFGLPTHFGKAEIGPSSRAFDGACSPAGWVGLAHDFDRIARTLYHVPPDYLRLYARYPTLTLRAYVQGLRAAGIFVSTDWLAQNFLTLRGRRPLNDPWNSYFHLKFPRLNLKDPYSSAHGWGRQLLRANPDFARTIRGLRAALSNGFSSAFRSVAFSHKADARKLKPALFRLRFYATRLSIYNCAPLAARFQKCLDFPWALEPSVSATALLSDPNAVNRFLECLFSRRALLVRIRAAWALGELGALRAVPALWRAAHPGYPLLLRLAALEALIRIDRYDLIPADSLFLAARVEKYASVRKYLYLLLSRLRRPHVQDLLRRRARAEQDFFARRAAEFALSRPGGIGAHVAPPARHPAAPLLPGRTRQV